MPEEGGRTGAGGSWAVCAVGACVPFPQTMTLPLSFLMPEQKLLAHVMPLSLNTTSLYGANPDT